MENVWRKMVDENKMVLAEDEKMIELFNKKLSKKSIEAKQIHTSLFPEAFIGRKDANIVVLGLNPGFCTEDIHYHLNNHYFNGCIKRNLKHEHSEHPFYLLDPNNQEAPGYKWWYKRTRTLIEKYGSKHFTNNFLCIEYFPYHSRSYKDIEQITESQKYSFHLVNEAIKRNAVIIIMRHKDEWLKAVPALKDYRYFELSSKQCSYLTKKNILNNGYDEICRILDK